jgi:hypothetical protein
LGFKATLTKTSKAKARRAVEYFSWMKAQGRKGDGPVGAGRQKEIKSCLLGVVLLG